MNDSNFSDVFEEYYFISALAYDVKVIKSTPQGTGNCSYSS
ncbi:unnamed protein product, partial [Vitis vinifera]|uniref:Uncharacterized protein n=1 Tax=Vitis vinifera TaxID=29760 RepID=D7TY56_VITVI